jgi:cysteine desulfurase
MEKNKMPLYLDAAATTPVDPRVLEAMLPYFSEIFGNASSQHIYGQQAKAAVEKAREQVASIVNVEPSEIIFTSGATEAINLAIKGYWEANRDRGNHLITVKTEHKAVLATHEYLETLGVDVTYLNVDRNGLISFDELTSSLRPDTLLVSAMHVNNETGIIQDIHRIAPICADQGIAFFTDATQAVAHIPTDYGDDAISLACFSAHKFGGPKGIGALVVKKGITIAPQIHGGGQENGLRSGTYNTPLIVGFGEACVRSKHLDLTSILDNRNQLIQYFKESHHAKPLFSLKQLAPHIICFKLRDEGAEELLTTSKPSIAASTGSACQSNLVSESHVYELVDKSPKSLFRISLNR